MADMAYVEVRDYALWPKHIHGDDELKTNLLRLHQGQLIELEVDGFCGVWKRMKQGKNPKPTEGLKAIGNAREHWHQLFRKRPGDLVPIIFRREL
jgi:hypothetical protein